VRRSLSIFAEEEVREYVVGTVAIVVIVGVCFVTVFGNWSIKKGWYDDYGEYPK
jgi:choline-glycine betaine transporter